MSKHTPFQEREHPAGMGGEQKIFKFDTGYGASVVRFKFSYGGDRGLWELGVIKFSPDGNWHLCYDTPVTSDVIGYQSDDEIEALLDQIKELQS